MPLSSFPPLAVFAISQPGARGHGLRRRGHCYLDGGAGSDTISAGDGNDLIVLDEGDYSIDGGSGIDILLAGDNSSSLTEMMDNYHNHMKCLFIHNNCPAQFVHLVHALERQGHEIVFLSSWRRRDINLRARWLAAAPANTGEGKNRAHTAAKNLFFTAAP